MIICKKNWYLIHRWLGLVVGIQLLAWSVSGFVFTILDSDNVHGDLERRKTQPPVLRFDQVRVSPADILSSTENASCDVNNICEIRLRQRRGEIVYEMLNRAGQPICVVNATTGKVHELISEEQAMQVALLDFTGDASIASIELIENNPPGEYRNGQLPAYRVNFNHHKNPNIYICAVTGAVIKRRNRPWRIFDFLWMLHIMDYRNRSNINNWLLTCMSLLAILTSASGIALWWWRRPRWLLRRGSPDALQTM